MSSPAITTSRFLYPEDRTTFVYGRPGEPIRTPPRTAIKLFVDEACTQPADVQTEHGDPIPYSTIYTGDDSLLPEFFGPPGYISRLWARVVGGSAVAYPLMAQFSDRLANLPMLTTGNGPPDEDVGAVGSFYIDQGRPDLSDPNARARPLLYGPRTTQGWPGTGTSLLGEPGPPGANFVWQQPSPSATWVMDHPLAYQPSVTTINTAGEVIIGDISYPPGQPWRVIASFGAPEAGIGVMT
jgi:hypothetical protein